MTISARSGAHFSLVGLAIFVFACYPLPLQGQYLGDQFLGLVGLKAGSQPGPGFYATLPLYFRDSSISINDAQGNQVLKNATADIHVWALPSVAVVTTYKILGANYGAAYTEWILNGILDQATTGFHRSTSYGFGDIYVQPIILGWHKAHADVTTGYAFFAPTGAGTSGQH